MLVLTCNPLFGDIEAETLPDVIWDKFNPTIPDAGISYNPEPSPINEPVNDPVLYELVKVLKDEVKV
jgi:hypothetical protein